MNNTEKKRDEFDLVLEDMKMEPECRPSDRNKSETDDGSDFAESCAGCFAYRRSYFSRGESDYESMQHKSD